MKKWRVLVHFRYTIGDEQEKDFESYDIEAKSEEEACEIANKIFVSTGSVTRFKTEATEIL